MPPRARPEKIQAGPVKSESDHIVIELAANFGFVDSEGDADFTVSTSLELTRDGATVGRVADAIHAVTAARDSDIREGESTPLVPQRITRADLGGASGVVDVSGTVTLRDPDGNAVGNGSAVLTQTGLDLGQ